MYNNDHPIKIKIASLKWIIYYAFVGWGPLGA